MTQTTKQNGVTLRVEFQNGFDSATLYSYDRCVRMSKGRVSGLYTISLEKARITNYNNMEEKEWRNTRIHTKLSQSDALKMFDKKQYELGFFA